MTSVLPASYAVPVGPRSAVAGVAGLYLFTGIVAAMMPTLPVFPYLLLGMMIVAWAAGPRWGIAFAMLALVEHLVLGRAPGAEPPSFAQSLIALANPLAAAAIALYLTARVRAFYERERNAARVDHLTDVMNRKGFEERLESEIARHGRSGAPFSVVYIDCDEFKAVNDRHGHGEGDHLLQAIGRAIHASVRRSDVVCRLGGDEFAVFFPDTGSAQALGIGNKLHDALSAIASPRWQVTFSVGIAIFNSPPPSWTAAMTFADELMYEAKRTGKDSTVAAEFPAAQPGGDPSAGPSFTGLARARGFQQLPRFSKVAARKRNGRDAAIPLIESVLGNLTGAT